MITQEKMNLIFCVFLIIIVAMLFRSLSQQPIDVHLTCGEIIERLDNAELKENAEKIEQRGNKNSNDKKEPSRNKAVKY